MNFALAVLSTSLFIGPGSYKSEAFQGNVPITSNRAKEALCPPTSTATNSGFIAEISSDDTFTQLHIIGLLTANRIGVVMEGSVGWAISVAPKDVLLATAILREDAAKRGYWIRFADEKKPDASRIKEDWKEATFLMPYESAIKAALPHGPLDIRKILGHPRVRSAARGYKAPYIYSVKYLRREYLAPVGTKQAPWRFDIAYEVKVEIGGSPIDKTAPRTSVSVQVVDNGKKMVR